MDNIEKRIRVLYKRINQDEDTTERACEGYINVLDGIKKELLDKGKIGWADLEDIQLGGFLGATEEDIDEATDEIVAQLEEIASGLGVDLEEEDKSQKVSNQNFPIINIHNIQSQNQEQNQSQNIQIESLKEDLENELRKSRPNESKVKKIINNIIEVAKSSASDIITAIFLKILGG